MVSQKYHLASVSKLVYARPMNKSLTHLAFIIDASGSMQPLRDDTIGGFNRILGEQRKASGKSDVTLVTFNTGTREVFTAVDAKHVKDLSHESYAPDGGTALLDAIGMTIDRLGALFAKTPEAKRPGKVCIVIITDGEENSSREYKLAQIRTMVERQREKYNWEFVYVGANVDAFSEAGSMGINTSNAYNYTSSSVGTQAVYGAMSSSLRSYSGGSSAQVDGLVDVKGVSPALMSKAKKSKPGSKKP